MAVISKLQVQEEQQARSFVAKFSGFDSIEIRKMDLDEDVPDLHDWFNRDYAKFWGMQGKSIVEVRSKFQEIFKQGELEVLMGVLESTGEKIFLLECYRPTHDILGKFYRAKDSDRGYHLIVAPPGKPVPDLTFYIMMALNQYIFRDASVQRIVGEPDLRNDKVLMRLAQAGYSFGKVVHLPHKTAQMIFVTREKFEALNHNSPPPKRELRHHALRVKYHMLLGRVIRKLFRA